MKGSPSVYESSGLLSVHGEDEFSVQDEAWVSISVKGSSEFIVRTSSIIDLFLLNKASWLHKWQVPVACLPTSLSG